MDRAEIIIRVLCDYNVEMPPEVERERKKVLNLYRKYRKKTNWLTAGIYANYDWLKSFLDINS